MIEAVEVSPSVPLVEEWKASEAMKRAFEIAASDRPVWAAYGNSDGLRLTYDGETVLTVIETFEARIMLEAIAHRLNRSTLGKAAQ